MKQAAKQKGFSFNAAAHCPPAILTFASDIGTPVDIFAKLSAEEQHAFLLESVEGDGRLSRYSFLGFDPLLTVVFNNGYSFITARDSAQITKEEMSNPIQVIQGLLQQYHKHLEEIKTKASESEKMAIAEFEKKCKELPFAGGFAGYMGYNASQYFENIPQQANNPQAVPQGYFGLYDAVVVFDHQYKHIHILSWRGEEHANSVVTRMLENKKLQPLQLRDTTLDEKSIFKQVMTSYTKEEYINAVKSCKEFITKGEAFQIVLSQRFSMPCSFPSLDIYRMLQATNPSPYAYYLKFPEFVYLGSSPETFLQCREGELLLRAIAGTRRRGANNVEDDMLCQELKRDEKEMAEHRMLVDLGRNDLGRVCQPGTIKPEELALITKYTHVMHMSTTIKGKLREDKNCFDAFQSCFPAGTVSGAPKIRAMQILAQLEPEQRGIYSGAVGYFDLHGNMDAAIAIRSALLKDNVAHVNAGGGIVFDSDPEAEYQESRNKAKSVLQAIKLAGAVIQ